MSSFLDEQENTFFFFFSAHTRSLSLSLPLSFSVSVSLSLPPPYPHLFFLEDDMGGGPRCYISLTNGEQRGAGLVCTPDAPFFLKTTPSS